MAKPKIRFKGFTDDWEQRKFGDLGSVAMCKRIFKEQTSTDGDIPFYKIGTFGAEPDAFISRELFEEYRGKFQYPNIGDMLISASGTIGRTVEYKGEEAYFQDSNIVWFKHDDRVDNSFLKCIYEIVKWSGIEGSTIKRLYNDIFLKTEFSMPKVAEQQQIGMYFQSLDHLITLHQRKNIYFYEKVTLVWEQRKLGEIASSFEYGLNAAAKEYDGENKYIRITDIDDNTHEFLTYNLTSPDIDLTDVENYKLAEGDILFARTGASVGKSYIYRDSDGLVYYAGFLIRARIREEYDAEFVFQSTLTDKYNKYIAVTSQRSGQPGVNAQEYSEFEIRVPEKEEQTKIGTYFHNLDHLITLHQCKCHLLLKLLHNDWEQRKLGKLVDRVTRKNQDLVSELPLTISAQYGLIDQNEFFDKRVASKDVSGYYLIENGEFAYNKSTSTDAPWGAVKRLDRYENGVLSTLYIVFGIKENNPVDSDFLVSYYSTNLWHKGIHEIAAEGARNHGLLNIAPADFFETELTMPQDIEEQKKIGKYFEELERLITLHHRKYIYILKSP